MDEEEELHSSSSSAVDVPPPDAKYGALSESLRKKIPESKLCAMFCGGRNCKYEDPSRWTEDLQAVSGLYSSWVTQNILATSRPTTEVIKKYKIIEQFKKFKIKTIMNLQIAGEHSSCGPPLEPSGFSYNPQHFMDAGVSFYNYAWKDYGYGSMSNIVDMVRVMQYAISEGKVAIHCHAGLGRTGVFIACYLVFCNRLDAKTAIQYVRSKRPGTVQTRSQMKCIHDFEIFLRPLRIIFSSVLTKRRDFTLSQFLSRQRLVVHGWEARCLKYLPKLIYICSERLLEIAGQSCKVADHKDQIFLLQNRLTTNKTIKPSEKPSKSSTASESSLASRENFPNRFSTETIVEAINVCKVPKSISLESFIPIQPSSHMMTTNKLSLMHARHLIEDNDTSLQGRDTESLSAYPSHSSMRNNVYGCLGSDVRLQVERVAQAMGQTEYSDVQRQKMEKYKQDANDSNAAWRSLRRETEAAVLAGLMWEWLDELQEPVLGSQDLPVMLSLISDPLNGLAQLEKGAHFSIRYLFHTISCLKPISPGLQIQIIQRICSTLTHQNMILELENEAERNPNQTWTSNDTGLMKSSLSKKLFAFSTKLIEVIESSLCSCYSFHQ